MFCLFQLLNALVVDARKEIKHLDGGCSQVFRQRHLLLENTSLFYQLDGYIVAILIQHDLFEQARLVLAALVHTTPLA